MNVAPSLRDTPFESASLDWLLTYILLPISKGVESNHCAGLIRREEEFRPELLEIPTKKASVVKTLQKIPFSTF